MPARSLVLTFVVLLAVALVVGAVAWQALGWFSSLRDVVVAALVWALLITGWVWLRRRLWGGAGEV